MHSYSHGHGGRQEGAAVSETRGRLLDRGWHYDLKVWCADTIVLRGSLRDLRLRVLTRAVRSRHVPATGRRGDWN